MIRAFPAQENNISSKVGSKCCLYRKVGSNSLKAFVDSSYNTRLFMTQPCRIYGKYAHQQLFADHY